MAQTKLLAAVLGTVSGTAAAQFNTYEIVVPHVVSPAQPLVRVELWAVFDPQWSAFEVALLDFHAAADPGRFSDLETPLSPPNPGNFPGELDADGDTVSGIRVGQICDDIGGIFPDTANPILIWAATWSTTDFTPRIVSLSTVSDEYALFINDDCQTKSFINDNFAEAFGQIQVIPSTGAVPVLALGAAVAARRRR